LWISIKTIVSEGMFLFHAISVLHAKNQHRSVVSNSHPLSRVVNSMHVKWIEPIFYPSYVVA